MKLLLICAIALGAKAAEPVTSAWIMSHPAASEQVRKLLPDVHEVIVEEEVVEVRSAGLSLLFLGPLQSSPGEGGVRDLRFRISRRPVVQEGEGRRIGPGTMGVFLNGVPVENRLMESSYLGQNMWHFDTVALKDPAHPMTLGVLQNMIANGAAHSPLLGFALDGFPIYGPWGFANRDGSGGLRRMSSGYRLRKIRERTQWADGTELTPSQYGPPVDGTAPLGTFAEDYEYRPGAGDLDESNGRFCVTPEYPKGTYAYFLTTNEASQLAFPYLLAERFKGRLPGVTTQPEHFTHDALVTGKPVELRFRFPGVHALEIVHDKPLHLMVVSADRGEFEHIHPQWRLGGVYSVAHIFAKPGKYRLFAQFTKPGEQERVESFDVEVAGAALPSPKAFPPISGRLVRPEHIRTGEDVAFSIGLSGAPIEPYLGAWGHFVFLDRELGNFIHAHPADSVSTAHTHVASGPPPSAVSFTTNFSEAGSYRLWAQFQVAGEPVVIPFDVEVSAGIPVTKTRSRIPEGAIAVAVDAHGFNPARIEVSSGAPVTLAITRAATPNCGSRIVFPSLGIERDLPVGETTVVELPKFSGEVAFACGMGMLRGVIVGVTRDENQRSSTTRPN
jgi:hypothetical protein